MNFNFRFTDFENIRNRITKNTILVYKSIVK